MIINFSDACYFQNNTTKLHFPVSAGYSQIMHELDEIWSNMLDEAITKAKASGRGDVAEYLALKASNDQLRSTGVRWLFESLIEIAAEFNRDNSSISIENENPHRFAFGNSHLVGSLLRFRQGVRCLTVEAGWTRTPADGFMRGNALAGARIVHFGLAQQNNELVLLRSNDAPQWFAVDLNGNRSLFDSNNLQRHFQIFLGGG